MYARNAESRFENGSSSRKIVGCMIIERPSATFWRSFTESRAAGRSSAAERPTVSATTFTRRSISSFSMRVLRGCDFRPKARFSYTDMCVKIA